MTLVALGVALLFTPHSSLANQFHAWDGNWYLSIATHGYPRHVATGSGNAAQTSIAFFPVFPALLRAVHVVTRLGLVKSGAVVVFGAGAVASVALWLLARRIRDEATADRTVALFVFFPGTIALSLLYSEAVAICLAVLCCLALVERRWLLAGLFGLLATASRSNAAAIVVAAAVAAAATGAAGAAGAAGGLRARLKPWIAPVLAAAGIAGYFAFLWAWTGVWDAWTVTERRGWNNRFRIDQGLIDLRHWLNHPFHDVSLNVVLPTLAFAIVATVLVLRTAMPVWLKVYAVTALAIAVTSTDLRPRFVLMAFPIFLALGDRTRHSSLTVLVGTFAGLLGLYTMLMSTPFYPSP